jgi:hypothetical protein
MKDLTKIIGQSFEHKLAALANARARVPMHIVHLAGLDLDFGGQFVVSYNQAGALIDVLNDESGHLVASWA